MKFLALDVETANEDYSSICQIGIASFENGKIVDTWKSFVNPEDHFSGINIMIHGITEESVKDSSTFPEIYETLRDKLSDSLVIHHMAFDRVAISRVIEKYDLHPFEIQWMDTAKIARRTWSEFSMKGYGLSNIAKSFGITFNHHDALEDAIAAGKIFIKATEKTSFNTDEWIKRLKQPIDPSHDTRKMITGNPNGPLFGETMVFTGSLSLSRSMAAKLASNIGCNVDPNVTKRTTILVIGTQDLERLKGKCKSNKQIKAEKLIEAGQHITMMTEEDFIKIVDNEEELN